jgi:DNA helicase IV
LSNPGLDEIGREQEYLSMLYRHVDGRRERAAARLAATLRETGGTPQARSQRSSTAHAYQDELARLDAVEADLCFGRLDLHDGPRRYIGRIGIFAESGEFDDSRNVDESGGAQPLLLDWRAPAARPFYLATAVSPEGVRRRRHIRTAGRTVTGLDDEVLDLSEVAAGGPAGGDGLVGEATLLAALGAARTGRMRDIVATIQAEQDRVIRAPLGGVLVVQGGPGTGKTAVALHRAAYLLYTHREQLSRRGVLVVGPNATFLRYISQVLPSLAETSARLATLGDLYPGTVAGRTEPAEVAEVKGRAVMAEVLATAVRQRQAVVDGPVEITVDDDVLTLEPDACARARTAALDPHRPHNLARPVFARHLTTALAGQLADRIGTDPYAFDPLGGDDAPGDPRLLSPADVAELAADLAEHPQVRALIDRLWPVLTPHRLLTDLFADGDRLAAAAPQLTAAERHLLRREPGGGWTPADVPLLDEAAELLGTDDGGAAALAERERRARVAYARGALEIAVGSRSFDAETADESELLAATDLLDAEAFAQRQEDRSYLTAAERAAADRTWAYGHIVVDEAQELSEMAWRLLMRRCPSRSMTVVGDVAQTGALAGTSSWARVLRPHVADRWRLTELTVCYRTPAEIMALAERLLAGTDLARPAPQPVRATGVPPWRDQVTTGAMAGHLAAAVRSELGRPDCKGAGSLDASRPRPGTFAGRIGVIVPAAGLVDLGAAMTAAVPGTAVGDRSDLESRVVVLTVAQARGLEFDSVVVVEPAAILAESARGRSDLYVALTRATQRLGLLYSGALPAELEP